MSISILRTQAMRDRRAHRLGSRLPRSKPRHPAGVYSGSDDAGRAARASRCEDGREACVQGLQAMPRKSPSCSYGHRCARCYPALGHPHDGTGKVLLLKKFVTCLKKLTCRETTTPGLSHNMIHLHKVFKCKCKCLD